MHHQSKVQCCLSIRSCFGTDKTNAAELSSGVLHYITLSVLISVTWTAKIRTSLPFHKFCQKLANNDLMNYTASLAADAIVNAISFIRHIVL